LELKKEAETEEEETPQGLIEHSENACDVTLITRGSEKMQ
jgi:hypothetical protein